MLENVLSFMLLVVAVLITLALAAILGTLYFLWYWFIPTVTGIQIAMMIVRVIDSAPFKTAMDMLVDSKLTAVNKMLLRFLENRFGL